jgi:hypothetical protein
MCAYFTPSFRVLKFMLPACRLNLSEVSRTKQEVERDWPRSTRSSTALNAVTGDEGIAMPHTFEVTLSLLRCLCYAIFVTLSLLRYLCYAIFVTPSLLRHLCYAIFVTPSLLRYLCYAIFVTPSLLRHLCYTWKYGSWREIKKFVISAHIFYQRGLPIITNNYQ